MPAQIQPQFVKARIQVIGIGLLAKERVQKPRVNEHHRAEVEVVAQTALLVINDGMQQLLAVLHLIAVAENHRSTCLTRHSLQPLHGIKPQLKGRRLHHYQRVARCGMRPYLAHRGCRLHVVYLYDVAALWNCHLAGTSLCHHQENSVHYVAASEVRHRRFEVVKVLTRQKAIYSLSHS